MRCQCGSCKEKVAGKALCPDCDVEEFSNEPTRPYALTLSEQAKVLAGEILGRN
jgi:hypothetical protein